MPNCQSFHSCYHFHKFLLTENLEIALATLLSLYFNMTVTYNL